MDYRLMEIKKYSNSIDKNREIIRNLTLPKEKMDKVLSDLEILSDCLKKYGNPIKYPLIIDGEEKYLVIAAYEKELYKRYFIRDKHPFVNRDGEKSILCFSLDYNFQWENTNKQLEMIKKAKENKTYYPDEIFFPISIQEETFIIYNWKELYNDLLEFILKKIEKENKRQQIKMNEIKKINEI